MMGRKVAGKWARHKTLRFISKFHKIAISNFVGGPQWPKLKPKALTAKRLYGVHMLTV